MKEKTSLAEIIGTHQAEVVEIAAILTSAPRWAIAFSPLDHSNIDRIITGLGVLWDVASLIFSVSFSIVEVLATVMVWHAYKRAKEAKDKGILLSIWVLSIIALCLFQIPPLFAKLTGVSIAALGDIWPIVYVTTGAVSVFVIIAGTAYSSQFQEEVAKKEAPKDDDIPFSDLPDDEGYWNSMLNDEMKPTVQIIETPNPVETPVVLVPKVAETRPDLVETKPEDAVVYTSKPDNRIVVNGYDGFVEKMKTLNGNKPKNGNQVSEVFKASKKTGYSWWSRYQESVK